MTLFLSVNNK